MRSVRLLLLGLACILITACGFRLQGVTPLPFDTLYTNIAENSDFGARLRRAILAASPKTRFVTEAADAQARLMQLTNQRVLRELSIDAQGQVEEYELNLIFVFQLLDAAGNVLLPPTTLTVTREIPYDPTAVQAKEGEIATMFNDMQRSLIDRVVRRLAAPDVAEAAAQAPALPAEAPE